MSQYDDEYFNEIMEENERLRAEVEKLRAALEAERERCYLAAVSTTCSVEETTDYYSGYCDGVQDAAAALKDIDNSPVIVPDQS